MNLIQKLLAVFHRREPMWRISVAIVFDNGVQGETRHYIARGPVFEARQSVHHEATRNTNIKSAKIVLCDRKADVFHLGTECYYVGERAGQPWPGTKPTPGGDPS